MTRSNPGNIRGGTTRISRGSGRGGRGAGRGAGSGQSSITNSSVSENPISNANNHSCGLCNALTSSDAIGCDRCPKWFHPNSQCTGLKAATVTAIQEEGGNAVRFVCTDCRCEPISPGTTSDSDVGNMNTALPQLYQTVKALAESVADLSKQVSLILTQSQGLPSTGNPQAQPTQSVNRNELFSEFREYEERKKRIDSVIVRGTSAGSDNEFVSVFGRIATKVLDRNVAITSSEVHCIKRDSCLYRVKISDPDVRREILSKSKILKNDPNYQNVYISRDLTYMQRQEMRKRREDYISRATNNDNLDVHSVPNSDAHGAANAFPPASNVASGGNF